MRRRLVSIMLIFIVLTLTECLLAGDPKLATDFNLQDLNKVSFSLSSYKDKQAVILFFWTTWCHYCRVELNTLKELYPQLSKEGFELLAINVGESPHRVNNFLKKQDLSFKVLLDSDTKVADAYRVLGVPTYILVNKKGYVVFKGHYFLQQNYKELILD